jgi:hypothetical protein
MSRSLSSFLCFFLYISLSFNLISFSLYISLSFSRISFSLYLSCSLSHYVSVLVPLFSSNYYFSVLSCLTREIYVSIGIDPDTRIVGKRGAPLAPQKRTGKLGCENPYVCRPRLLKLFYQKNYKLLCYIRTEDLGFESCQGVRFLGIYTLQCCCHNLICIVIVCTWEQ